MRVLIVEDDPTLRMVIGMVLERDGYEIDEAPHGQAALGLIAGRRPDVVVADLKMPVMGGLELIQRLSADAATAHVPVILLSGAADLGDAGRQANAVLAKPFDPADLLATVRSLIAS
ncbi:MAG TPA: response regulator [Candidatus Baltobacterales bacterium]|nr:response regulator [Candidatus Baltobacterales bacterium]